MKNYSLENPFAENDLPSPVKDQEQAVPSRYQEMVDRGRELLELPKKGGGESFGMLFPPIKYFKEK